jgi:hypothetical protein
MSKRRWLTGLFLIVFLISMGAVFARSRATAQTGQALHIDVPVKLEKANVVMDIGHMVMVGDTPFFMGDLRMLATDMSDWKAQMTGSPNLKKANEWLPPTKLVIFGNPKGGTPLMRASPTTAIDLPLKILVAEDSQGKVWISYNSPEYLKERHGLPADLLPNIAVVETLATKAGE